MTALSLRCCFWSLTLQLPMRMSEEYFLLVLPRPWALVAKTFSLTNGLCRCWWQTDRRLVVAAGFAKPHLVC